jgi:hypothetical protein
MPNIEASQPRETTKLAAEVNVEILRLWLSELSIYLSCTSMQIKARGPRAIWKLESYDLGRQELIKHLYDDIWCRV